VPKRLARLGVLLLIVIAVAIVPPKAGQAAIANARIAAAIPSTGQATSTPSSPANAPATAVPSAKHTITVKFDYDFSRSPACSAKITSKCVQQFNVYDISGGAQKRIKLFSLPVPARASGQMKGIAGTSPQLAFETGKHFLGVTAQWPDGKESQPTACETVVEINP
jgi:hypothetical protein